MGQESLCSGQYWTRAPQKYKSEASLSRTTFSVVSLQTLACMKNGFLTTTCMKLMVVHKEEPCISADC